MTDKERQVTYQKEYDELRQTLSEYRKALDDIHATPTDEDAERIDNVRSACLIAINKLKTTKLSNADMCLSDGEAALIGVLSGLDEVWRSKLNPRKDDNHDRCES